MHSSVCAGRCSVSDLWRWSITAPYTMATSMWFRWTTWMLMLRHRSYPTHVCLRNAEIFVHIHGNKHAQTNARRHDVWLNSNGIEYDSKYHTHELSTTFSRSTYNTRKSMQRRFQIVTIQRVECISRGLFTCTFERIYTERLDAHLALNQLNVLEFWLKRSLWNCKRSCFPSRLTAAATATAIVCTCGDVFLF